MPDWSKSMQQTFEYYEVDPGTWRNKNQIDDIISCQINWDKDSDTLGSATIDIIDSLGEVYIRAYLVTIQNGLTERHPLGTFLVQTPTSNFDGMIRSVSMDAYTPLIELKESVIPLGYYIPKNANVMDNAYLLTREHLRAPVVRPICDIKLNDDFVAMTDDTWASFIIDLTANAEYELDLDELGRVIYVPKQDLASLQPKYTYTDDNSSILYPEVTLNHDIFGIPNVVEVVYSNGSSTLYSKVINSDPNSPVSTVRRGREIVYRATDVSLPGLASQFMIDQYAEQLLKELSSVEYTVTYTHGYNGVRLGDCVRLNYKRAGLVNIKAKVISQSIRCETGCPVEEKAVFTTKLWR